MILEFYKWGFFCRCKTLAVPKYWFMCTGTTVSFFRQAQKIESFDGHFHPFLNTFPKQVMIGQMEAQEF